MENSRNILKKLLDKRVICILREEVSEIEVDKNRCDKDSYIIFHSLIGSYQANNLISIDEYNIAFESVVKYGYLPLHKDSELYKKIIGNNIDLIDFGGVYGR